jgi:hypothetical protein
MMECFRDYVAGASETNRRRAQSALVWCLLADRWDIYVAFCRIPRGANKQRNVIPCSS